MTGVYRAAIVDSDVMAAIHASAFAEPDAWGKDVFSMQLGLANVVGLLHPSGGMILLRVAADEAEVLTLAVSPGARRAGIGGSLLAAAIGQAATMGVRTVFLEVSVRNSAALQLYSAAGFVRAGRRRRYYSDNADALLLRLDVREAGGPRTALPLALGL